MPKVFFKGELIDIDDAIELLDAYMKINPFWIDPDPDYVELDKDIDRYREVQDWIAYWDE